MMMDMMIIMKMMMMMIWSFFPLSGAEGIVSPVSNDKDVMTVNMFMVRDVDFHQDEDEDCNHEDEILFSSLGSRRHC